MTRPRNLYQLEVEIRGCWDPLVEAIEPLSAGSNPWFARGAEKQIPIPPPHLRNSSLGAVDKNTQQPYVILNIGRRR